MPVGSVAGGEGPADGFDAEAILDRGVLGQVLGVVVIVELEVLDRPIEKKGNEGQKKTNLPDQRQAGGIESRNWTLHSSGSITK